MPPARGVDLFRCRCPIDTAGCPNRASREDGLCDACRYLITAYHAITGEEPT